LSAREAGITGLHEGLPEFLVEPLQDWLFSVLEERLNLVKRIRIRLGLVRPAGDRDDESGEPWFFCYATPKEHLLDIVDAALDLLPVNVLPPVAVFDKAVIFRDEDEGRRKPLQQIFTDARSVYAVTRDGTGLERRIPPIAASMLDNAETAAAVQPDAGSAAAQLREASDAVRALHPDSPKAYSLAIKAVESAAHSVIEPNNKKATLGTMLGILRSKPAAFEIEIPGQDGITTVTAMMTLLWEGQTSRHGSSEPAVDESFESAEMAVQLASLLVLWFTTGQVRSLAAR
jgi:hypothetical protein